MHLMLKQIILLGFCSFFTQGIAQNDSTKNVRSRSIFRLNVGAISNYWGLYNTHEDEPRGIVVKDELEITSGFEAALYTGIKRRRVEFSWGLGYAYLPDKGKFEHPNGAGGIYYTRKYTLIRSIINAPLNINWQFGRKSYFLLGIYSSLNLMTDFYRKETTTYFNGYKDVRPDYRYESMQLLLMFGFNYGYSFKISDMLSSSIILNTKVSSPVRRSEYNNTLLDQLITQSIGVNLTFSK